LDVLLLFGFAWGEGTVISIAILSAKYVEGSKLCVLVFSARQHFFVR